MSGRATTPLFLLLAGLALLGASAGAAQKAAVARDVYDLLENDRRQVTDADVMKLCEDKSLTELDLSGCSQLTVACLKDIAALKSLKLLDISDIRNLGEPSTFAALKELPSLEELRMRNAESFKGEGVDQLKRLKRLDVSRASGKFGDSGFAGFKDMSGLTHLYINQSRNYHANKGMSYAGVKHLEGLVNLKALGLYGLHGLKDEDYNALFSKLKALEDLNIGFNWAHKGEGLKLPENLRILDARESFSLLDEPILGMKKDKLESLNLFHCYKITNATLESLKGLTGLKRLALGGIRDLTDEGLLHLQGNTGLSHLSLNDNENFTDKGIAVLGQMNEMEALDLWHIPNLKGPGLSSLKNMSKLRSLTLSDCKSLTDEGLQFIADKAALKELYLDACEKITGNGLKYLSRLSGLEELTLTSCTSITPAGLANLENLKSLKFLDLTGCTGIAPSDVHAMRESLPNCEVVF